MEWDSGKQQRASEVVLKKQTEAVLAEKVGVLDAGFLTLRDHDELIESSSRWDSWVAEEAAIADRQRAEQEAWLNDDTKDAMACPRMPEWFWN